MKNWITLCLTLYSFFGFSQKTELGIHAGVSNYWGDLAPSFQLDETHAAGGVFARINFNHTWAMRMELNKYTVSGKDANFDFNKDRNLSFKSQINEAALIFEFNYLKYGPYVLHKKFTSYVYAGVGGFSFNPQSFINGAWVDLSDYKTENVIYKKLSMDIPFGIGFKYMLSKKFAMEAQLGFRKTFTDYLDDVSTVYPDVQSRFTDGGLTTATLTDRSIELYGKPQYKLGYNRGDPTHNDWFTSFTIGMSFRLNTKTKCARFF
ncbi:MAG: PorT family protein [Bacteroidia bacterium]|nr:PorT family protein [Bacteroidia bacterium]MCF8426787.1 PorT family protein [Bacteroidia bacterium]MCF8445579.1 PorT family protein [Bacteroidia bacterium]